MPTSNTCYVVENLIPVSVCQEFCGRAAFFSPEPVGISLKTFTKHLFDGGFASLLIELQSSHDNHHLSPLTALKGKKRVRNVPLMTRAKSQTPELPANEPLLGAMGRRVVMCKLSSK